jgi:hypothetical protein
MRTPARTSSEPSLRINKTVADFWIEYEQANTNLRRRESRPGVSFSEDSLTHIKSVKITNLTLTCFERCHEAGIERRQDVSGA